jgi:Uma2 family endonuclease
MSKSNLATVEELYTDEEYISLEREANEKHELANGEIIAMAGASREHNLICVNIAGELRQNLKGSGCETYATDMRVRMKEGNYAYPDVVVVCDEPQFADGEFDTLLNPVIVIEILSKSTRFRDKTEKLETYQKMESISECLIIEQDLLRIEHYIKQTPKQWLFRIYEDLDEIVKLESIGCEIPLVEIYAQINFEESLVK